MSAVGICSVSSAGPGTVVGGSTNRYYIPEEVTSSEHLTGSVFY